MDNRDADNNDDQQLFLPLVDQESICLPLPINVVSQYWNVQLSLEDAVQNAKKYSNFNGSILIEGIEFAEKHGLTCKIVHSSLTELKKIIDAGIPPIVILPGIPEITQHASVITGYNDKEKTIFHYVQKGNQDGEQQEGAIPQDIFDNEWSEEGRLLIVLAPDETLASVPLDDQAHAESNRLCFASERYTILKDARNALESLQRALKLYPENSTALNLLGLLYNDQNSPECVRYYTKCLETNPRSYLSCSGLGNFYLKSGQFEKAEEFYSQAIKINPKRSAKIYKNRAFLREKRGSNSGAKDDLKTYLKYYPRAYDRGVIEQAIREL